MRLTLAATLLGLATAGAAPVISEFMYHPAHTAGREDPRAEWVEIYNPGTSAVLLADWQFTAGISFTFPNVSISPGKYLVVAADLATFQSLYPDVHNVIGGWTGQLSNRGETILLTDQSGSEIDRIDYADEGDWAVRRPGPDDEGHTGWTWVCPADGGGSSMELQNPALSNRNGLNWLPSPTPLGSPGEQNSVFSLNVPPLIENVSHYPAVPRPTDLVLIRARLTDDLRTPRGVVRYRLSSHTPGEFRTVPMRDDGRGGDALAKDGIHSAILPAQPHGTVVEFYLEAFDATQSRTWPGPTDQGGTQGANLLYEVDRDVHSGPVPLYRLVLPVPENDEFNNLPLGGNERRTNAQFNTTFIAQVGESFTTIYQCGTRLRGASSRSRYPRSLKVRLPSTASWQGQTDLNLNSQFSYNQLLGSRFYREAGLPAYEAKAVKVHLNGIDPAAGKNAPNHASFTRHYGLYSHNEPLNSAFANHHFPSDPGGNLYRKTGTGSAWEYFPGSLDLAADYSGVGWEKENNSAANDWADLHNFIGVMTRASGPDYLEQVETVLDLESWLRTLAVSTILTNSENSLFTGANDDFALYRGSDGKFRLLVHDLDTILGQGDESRIAIGDLPHTILDFVSRGDSLDQLEPLFRQTPVIRRYYRILAELLDGPFDPARANATIDDTLKWMPPSCADTAKDFLAARRADILNQIRPSLTARSGLPVVDGFPYITTGQALIFGSFDATAADSVLVNGSPAFLSYRTAFWNFLATGLLPGINRLVIEERDASGAILASSSIDLHYDDGDTVTTGGPLSADASLDSESGPWVVSSTLVVPAGRTLTIEPGASLYFTPGTGIEVQPGGSLVCQGTESRRIRLTRPPGSDGTWKGLKFTAPPGQSSLADNIIAYTDLAFGDTQGSAIVVSHSPLTLDHVTWDHITNPVLELESPQVEIRDCLFPSLPSSVVIHGHTLEDDDYLILRRNVFLPSTGGNDLISFAGGRRPGPILAVYDNLFTGATDDCIDLDGSDAHLEGNIFMKVHLDQPGDSTSNAIAADHNSHLTVVRNLFYDIDHAVLLMNEADCVFEHNTVVKATIAALSFDEPLRANTIPGERLDMDSNLFVDCSATFAHALSVSPEPNPVIIAHRNFLPTAQLGIGVDNFDLEPFLANQEAGPSPKSNWNLLPGSPAIGTGRNGLDRGALVPPGASASGLPAAVTDLTSLTLVVRGPGITRYRWRLVTNAVPGPWSADTLASSPVSLRNLNQGTYRIDLLARDSAGYWQEPAEFSSSTEWTVVASVPGMVRLNEVFARSAPATDLVELRNGTDSLVDLTGWFLTDDPEKPAKNPLSGTIAAGGYLHFSGASVPSLDADGETLYLFLGPTLIDSVSWGPQVPEFSIGRSGPDDDWFLTTPTLGFPNQRAGTAPTRDLKINEWLAASEVRYGDEFVELYNPGDSPAALGGLWISDSPDRPRRHQIPALSFIPPKGFLLFDATGALNPDPDELPFTFNAFHDWILLSDRSGSLIDQVRLACLSADRTEGRNPDGSTNIETFLLGTPGYSNNRTLSRRVESTLVRFQSPDWAYLDNADPPADWVFESFNDARWEVGRAPLGRETTSLPVPLATDPTTRPGFDYTLGRKNYYFRRTFEFSGDPERTFLNIATYLDDGAVFYLNGEELYRHNMPDGPLDSSTWAAVTVGNASIEGPFPISSELLRKGTNQLAVVTYQAGAASTDIVFDCELTALETVSAPPSPAEVALLNLLAYLRITEVMYNPPDGRDGEFIELQNISETVNLDLTRVRITEGVTYTFPPMSLRPGERIVVAKNISMFRIIHGPGPKVAGEYESKLDNEGETIALALPAPWDMNIQRFTYRHEWHPTTDEVGRSLELIDPNRPLSSWNDPNSWIASHKIHGSPGYPNTASSFVAWSAALHAGLGDPLEYAFGPDALTADYFPVLSSLEFTPGAGLAVTFLHPALAPPDAVFHLQSSTDLESWATHATRIGNGPWTGAVRVESVLPPTGLGLVVLRLPDAGPILFTRMLVEIAP